MDKFIILEVSLGTWTTEDGDDCHNAPETVDSPRVGWTGGRVGVPELGLQEGATRVIEAAGGGLR